MQTLKIIEQNENSINLPLRQTEYKFYSLACMVYLTLDLMSYLYVYYIVDIHHFILSFSVFFFTTTYMITDVIVEVYGYRYARRLIWFGLICEAIFSLFIYVLGHIHLPIVNNNHVNTILSQDILRIFFVSLLTTPVGDFVNSFAISRWKIQLKGKYFGLRSICATTLGIIIYCILSHTMLFYGVLSLKQLCTLIGSSILFKFLYITICAAPASIIMRILKRADRLDQYDYDVNYNPFCLN
ncbi:MAG TPA: queuosine precursor transporter [Gammaproteobacteria bacterium]|nr:queuosine precursor transporter [Gammaproteobacteria bacterium]